MRLGWVELRDFRNHAETRLDDLGDGVHTFVGANGEGKTNLLEGIAFLFFLQSPRRRRPSRSSGGRGRLYTRGEVETAGGRVLIEIEIPGQG